MKKFLWLAFTAALLLSACQTAKTAITIIDKGTDCQFSTSNRVPADILSECKITLGTNDRLFYQGSNVRLDIALPEATSYVLTVRRAVVITIEGEAGKVIQTSAQTIGEAMTEAGYTLYAADRLDPPAETPITGPINVTYQPSHEIVVTVDDTQVRIRTASAKVEQVLAEAGVALVGLDTSLPDESDSIPKDGQIRVVRVIETVALIQKTIAYNTRTELSADLEIDQQALLQGGEPGLTISRQRTRSEDGVQTSQVSESESIVRPPQDRVMGIGTKIVIRTATVDGVTIEYWRVLRLYATSYSPCRAMRPDGKCGTSTSSGMAPGKGVVAMQYYWYLLFGFEHLYVPGYGPAIVGDVGGGYLTSHYWIDLGYDDNNYVPWSDWVTVYFLTPVPANPGYILP
jgi:resuscitation-promoting factor RpfB